MVELPNREFRKIPSLLYLYEINGDGTILRNVKSKKHLKIFKKSHNSKTEYWCVQINLKHHIQKKFIHNLVAECWLGAKPEGMQTDHIDRNSLNNDYRNLRYVTKSEQMKNRDYSAFSDTFLKNLAIRNKGIVLRVTLIKDGEEKTFNSARQAAIFLAQQYGKKVKSFSDKFHLRRSHIFDYDVKYQTEWRDWTQQPHEGKEQSK